MNFYEELFKYVGCATGGLPGIAEPTEAKVMNAADRTVMAIRLGIGRTNDKPLRWLDNIHLAFRGMACPDHLSEHVAVFLCQIAEQLCPNGRARSIVLALFLDLLQRRHMPDAVDDFICRLKRTRQQEAEAEKMPEAVFVLRNLEEAEKEDLKRLRRLWRKKRNE